MGTSELHLTSLEQSLLYLLAANAGRVVTREEILDSLWGTDYVAESNVVDRQIRNLRTRSWTTGGSHVSSPRSHARASVSFSPSRLATKGLKLSDWNYSGLSPFWR